MNGQNLFFRGYPTAVISFFTEMFCGCFSLVDVFHQPGVYAGDQQKSNANDEDFDQLRLQLHGSSPSTLKCYWAE
jgi:hypothetical protein